MVQQAADRVGVSLRNRSEMDGKARRSGESFTIIDRPRDIATVTMELTASGSDTSITNMLASMADQPLVLKNLPRANSASFAACKIDPPSFDESTAMLPSLGACSTSSSYSLLSNASSSHQPMTPPYKKRVFQADVQVASIFAEPSAFLQRVLRYKTHSTELAVTMNHANKRQRVIASTIEPLGRQDDLLHRACLHSNASVEIVQHLLRGDPAAASRSIPMHLNSNEYFSYPIHLAIQHECAPDVLSLLIHAAPQVLSQPDGPRQETALHLLLRKSPNDAQTALLMILSQSEVASMRENCGNYPLHVACRSNAPFETVQYLLLVNEQAQHVPNRDGQTPNEIMAAKKEKE
ncbi:hypothetical protein MPSEU_000988500 [Mayamaea pseudoterrestris]|nr:hypothetical protein MPSEU_000988500 [Mayamaea pseudoterrestris]